MNYLEYIVISYIYIFFKTQFKALENMVSSAESNSRYTSDKDLGGNKTEMPLMHTRRSGSPFKCITNIVNQVHMEKEQELCKVHNRVHELEALLSAKQQEV
jgi:kinesin family member 15